MAGDEDPDVQALTAVIPVKGVRDVLPLADRVLRI